MPHFHFMSIRYQKRKKQPTGSLSGTKSDLSFFFLIPKYSRGEEQSHLEIQVNWVVAPVQMFVCQAQTYLLITNFMTDVKLSSVAKAYSLYLVHELQIDCRVVFVSVY